MSTEKISDNGLCASIFNEGNFRTFKRSRLSNRHAQEEEKEEEKVLDSFDREMEADTMSSRRKVRDSLQDPGRVLTMSTQEAVLSKNGRTEWFHNEKRIVAIMKL